MATVTRMRMDPETRAYAEKRRAEGRTTKEIRRSLKRYLAAGSTATSTQHTRRKRLDKHRRVRTLLAANGEGGKPWPPGTNLKSEEPH